MKILENGTPQGSVISPILFNIMINDIFTALPVNVEASQFADDGSFWRRFGHLPFVQKSIQHCLDLVHEWCCNWGFKISHSKSVAMLFTRRKYPPNIELYLGEDKVNFVSEFKFLGIYFDQKLTWSCHITNVVIKCNKVINLLKSISKIEWGADKSSLLLLYKALILSRMDYGCPVFMDAAKCHLLKLDRIQSKALRICSGAFPTTPVAALQVECLEMPLHLRHRELALKYYIKIKSMSNYQPATDILSDCVEYVMYDWPCAKTPFGFKIQKLAQQYYLHDTDSVDVSALPKIPPWCLTQPGLVTELNSIVNKQMAPNVVKALAQDFIAERYCQFTHIYTDASKDISRGRVAAAFWIPDFEISYKFRLHDCMSVFAAELIAILEALRWVDEHNHEAIIFTDSMAAVKAIESGLSGSRSDVIFEILKLDTHLNLKYISCDVVWIPSHVGLDGNEFVDKLAKSALDRPSIDIAHIKPCPRDFNNQLSDCLYSEWQNQWNTGSTSRHMFALCPLIKGHRKIRRRKRRDEVILTRLRLGHCGLNAYKSILDKDVSPNCSSCNQNAPETISHFLLECTAHDTFRHELRRVIFETDKSFSLYSILGPNILRGNVQRAILDFVTNSGKYNII